MTASVKQNLYAFLAGVVAFILTFLVLKWPILVAVLISIGTFIGVYLLATPVIRIGDLELAQLENGEELKLLFDQSVKKVQGMKKSVALIENKAVKDQVAELAETSQSILAYLEENPREISGSRHFLDYYIKTGHKIIHNYVEMEEAKISQNKFTLITARTEESLDILNEIYANQRDGYHLDRMRDLEVETELLEKTLKLGGGYIDEK